MARRNRTITAVAHDPNPAAVIGSNSGANDKFLAGLAKQLGKVQGALTDNKALVAASGKSRLLWAEYGRICAEAREALASTKAFGAWLVENQLNEFTDRNTRSDAMWLTKMPEEFITDVVSPDLNNPRQTRVFYRNTVKRILETLGEDTSSENMVSKLSADDQKFVGVLPSDLWDSEVAAHKAKVPPTTFAGSSVAEAVAMLIAKIMKHSSPADVAAGLLVAIIDENDRGPLAWTGDPEPPVDPEPVDDDDDDDDADPVEPEPVDGEPIDA